MNPQNDKATIYKDEISLYDLWKNIIKRKKLIFSIFIISIISAGIISFMMPKIYRGEVGVRLQPTVSRVQAKELISAKELLEIIGKFDREKIEIIFPQNSDSITRVMMAQISGSNDKFKIIVELSETAHFKDVIKTLLQYLNNVPLIKRAVEQNREQLAKSLEEIDNVVKRSQQDANSFQKMMIREKINLLGFNPVQFNKMLSELEVERITLRQSIQTLAGIEIITEPIISPKPVRPRPMLYMAIAGVSSLIVGVFLAMFLIYLDRIKR